MSLTLAMTYLYANLDRLAHMPWAGEAWDEIDHATATIERMVDRRAPAKFAGTCDVCKGDLYATGADEMVKCGPCGLTYTLSVKRDEMLDALDDRLVRASEAIHILPSLGTVVSRKDIDRWTAMSRLFPHGRDEQGRPLYRVSEVRELAANAKRRTRATA